MSQRSLDPEPQFAWASSFASLELQTVFMAKRPVNNSKPKHDITPEQRQMHIKLALLSLAVLINLLGFSIVIPLIPYYLISALHLSHAAAATDRNVGQLNGLLLASYAAMQFLFAPFWGSVSDRVGRLPILIGSLVGDAVFYALFGLSIHNLDGLFAARILAGIFSSASLSVAQAYVADITPPAERAIGLGYLGAAFGLGFVLGPAVGGLLGHFNLALPMYVASALALINVGYIVKFLPESRPPQKADAGGRRAKLAFNPLVRFVSMLGALKGPVGVLYLLTFVVTFAFANMEGTFTPYLVQHFGYTEQSSTQVAGGVFAYIGVFIVLIQGGAIRPLKKRYSEVTLIIAGIALMALGFLTFALPVHLIWLLVGPLIPLAIGSGLNSPALRSLVSRHVCADVQGQALGLSASFDSLARTLGPFVGGLLYMYYGQAAPYWFAAVIMCGALALAVALKDRLLPVDEASIGYVEPIPAGASKDS